MERGGRRKRRGGREGIKKQREREGRHGVEGEDRGNGRRIKRKILK